MYRSLVDVYKDYQWLFFMADDDESTSHFEACVKEE